MDEAPLEPEVVDDETAELLRRKSVVERLRLGNQMSRSNRRLIEIGVTSRHPDWDALRVQREVARRWLSGSS